MEFFNLIELEFEMDLVPFIATAALSAFSTAHLGDNCAWFYYKYNTLIYNFRMTKKIATCGVNFKEVIMEARDWNDVIARIVRHPFSWLSHLDCHYDAKWGANQ